MRTPRLLVASCILLLISGCDNRPKKLEVFTCEEGAFKVLMPGIPTHNASSIGPATIHIYEGKNPGIEYAVGYGVFPSDVPTDAGTVNMMFQAVREKSAEEVEGEIIYSTATQVNGHAGCEYMVRSMKYQGKLVKAKVFLIGRKIFMLGVSGERIAVNSRDAARFFASFKADASVKRTYR